MNTYDILKDDIAREYKLGHVETLPGEQERYIVDDEQELDKQIDRLSKLAAISTNRWITFFGIITIINLICGIILLVKFVF